MIYDKNDLNNKYIVISLLIIILTVMAIYFESNNCLIDCVLFFLLLSLAVCGLSNRFIHLFWTSPLIKMPPCISWRLEYITEINLQKYD